MPGLLPPRPAADEVKASEPAEDAPPEEAAAEVAEEVVAAPAAEPETAAEEEDEDEDRGEPLFEISDRRATILADRVGIVFRLDGEEADFTWDEIGAVEIDTPRFSKRFVVTVYTGPRRWFEAHVEAKSRGLLKTWTAELDAVLDEHFEEPEDEAVAAQDDEAGAVAEAAEGGKAAEDGKTAAEA
ncbi:hypothetical protein [Actinacidiphila paucisporea]|uniref:Uncharacterized protein n=1 Tax=Actinacidiphila paucisporea TaxID=310782 RepID=A0A1M7BSM1_9ACTN|nr:hypothetical protein [Actinacidiphila paucisporea]SHL57944.1 hypothetical protein SAMN05216499_10524 [Actinacidiphila paucisporea]